MRSFKNDVLDFVIDVEDLVKEEKDIKKKMLTTTWQHVLAHFRHHPKAAHPPLRTNRPAVSSPSNPVIPYFPKPQPLPKIKQFNSNWREPSLGLPERPQPSRTNDPHRLPQAPRAIDPNKAAKAEKIYNIIKRMDADQPDDSELIKVMTHESNPPAEVTPRAGKPR